MRRRHLKRRARLEAAIERAIALLDEMDGDPDLEPVLAGLTCVGECSRTWGAVPIEFDQRHWADGRNDDREQEHDGREPNEDEEAWRQAAESPLVVVDTLGRGYSQGGELKYRFVRLEPTR